MKLYLHKEEDESINKKCTKVEYGNTCPITTHIESAPKYHDSIKLGEKHIVQTLLRAFKENVRLNCLNLLV